jgi:phage anti-repressor protein
VELVENSLHPIVEELEQWETIIGEHYLERKLEEQRNSLACKPYGYDTY